MANDLTLLGSIEQRIAYHMAGAARECIEVGRCLIEAKEIVPAGGWTEWLAKQGIAERQAQRLMKVCREVPEGSYLNKLSISKIGEILALPDADQREAVAQRAVEDNMTVKELRGQIAEMRAEMEDAQKRQREVIDKRNAVLAEIDEQRQRAEREKEALQARVRDLLNAPAQVIETVPEDVTSELERLRDENDYLSDELEEQAELRKKAQQELLDLRTSGGERSGGINIMDGAEIMVGFLGKVGCYTSMKYEIAQMSDSERSYLGNYVDMISVWCSRFRDALDSVGLMDGELL